MRRAYVSKRQLECNISGETTDVITELIAFNHAFYSQTLKTGGMTLEEFAEMLHDLIIEFPNHFKEHVIDNSIRTVPNEGVKQ